MILFLIDSSYIVIYVNGMEERSEGDFFCNTW